MSSIAVVPVSLSVPAALTPWRTKKVASVTMKLGSFVLMTVIPLIRPITRPNSSTSAIAGQMFMCACVARYPSSRPELPIMTPAERSNSPPIISSATGTATIPYCAAWSVQPAAMAGSPSQLTARAKYPNARKTAIAPSSAPISGRASRRLSGPTRTRRSSSGAVGAAVSAIRSSLHGWATGRPPTRVVLASAFRCERGDLRRVRLVDDAGAGEHRLAVADRVQVRLPEHGEDHRQIALQVLLLVDREQHLPGPDLLDRPADVERADLRAFRDDRQDLDVAPAEHRLDARGALLQAGVTGLVDHDQNLLRAGLLELLPGPLPCDVLGLADVDLVRRQRVECTEPRVHGDDLDPLLRGLRERVPERARVGHRRGDDVRPRGDRRVDPCHLLGDVVVGVHLRDADAAGLQILLRLVDAPLEDRPERACIPVGDDRHLDAARRGRAERG